MLLYSCSYMKKRFIIPFLLPLLIFCIHVTKAQISVQSPNGWTPTQLINNVLVLPPHISGVYITNGTFNNLATALPKQHQLQNWKIHERTQLS